jgi:hypothetical protein
VAHLLSTLVTRATAAAVAVQPLIATLPLNNITATAKRQALCLRNFLDSSRATLDQQPLVVEGVAMVVAYEQCGCLLTAVTAALVAVVAGTLVLSHHLYPQE